jgi:hypothetical protein
VLLVIRSGDWHRKSPAELPRNGVNLFELLGWRPGLDTSPPLATPIIPGKRGGAFLPVQGGPGCAFWGTRGSGWIPQGSESR